MIRWNLRLASVLTLSCFVFACSDDGEATTTEDASSTSDSGDGDGDSGDGDGDGDTTDSGDGDGDTTDSGDGDGDTTDSGDGDGDTTDSGDGDGDTTDSGDGDGDTTDSGDGDGDGDMGDPFVLEGEEGPDGTVGKGEFWIDAVEVSVADYVAFLDSEPSLDNLPEECVWKVDFVPNDWDLLLEGSDTLPVREVDWCDAWAYCEAQGKRLCGNIGGEPAALGDKEDETNEWFKACTDAVEAREYPYGNNYDGTKCNVAFQDLDEVVVSGSYPECEGSIAGLYDMSGNVWEWTSACATDEMVNDQDQVCRRRGGSFQSDPNDSRCAVGSTRARNFRSRNTGIRCCLSL